MARTWWQSTSYRGTFIHHSGNIIYICLIIWWDVIIYLKKKLLHCGSIWRNSCGLDYHDVGGWNLSCASHSLVVCLFSFLFATQDCGGPSRAHFYFHCSSVVEFCSGRGGGAGCAHFKYLYGTLIPLWAHVYFHCSISLRLLIGFPQTGVGAIHGVTQRSPAYTGVMRFHAKWNLFSFYLFDFTYGRLSPPSISVYMVGSNAKCADYSRNNKELSHRELSLCSILCVRSNGWGNNVKRIEALAWCAIVCLTLLLLGQTWHYIICCH